MDYQNRAGSKKGAGGIASDAQLNLQRRKKVDELLREGEDVPYTFEGNDTDFLNAEISGSLAKKDPYIYKNHSGKLVCKLCNTMHMSWTSVERHLKGKKHGLNVIRRGTLVNKHMAKSNLGSDANDIHIQEFQKSVELRRKNIKSNNVEPLCKLSKIQDEESGLYGIAIQVDYTMEDESNDSKKFKEDDQELLQPFIKIVSKLELMADTDAAEQPGQDKHKNTNKEQTKNSNLENNANTVTQEGNINEKYLVIAYEPFNNIGLKLPANDIVIDTASSTELNSFETFNEKCTYWDKHSKYFYIQFFFKKD